MMTMIVAVEEVTRDGQAIQKVIPKLQKEDGRVAEVKEIVFHLIMKTTMMNIAAEVTGVVLLLVMMTMKKVEEGEEVVMAEDGMEILKDIQKPVAEVIIMEEVGLHLMMKIMMMIIAAGVTEVVLLLG